MTQYHPSPADTAGQRDQPPVGPAKRRERLAESTLNLLAFDTQNPPGETTELLAWLREQIEGRGLNTEYISVDALEATAAWDDRLPFLLAGSVKLSSQR